MRNWEQYVRSHLSLADLAPERESRIVRELASQLEDFYREAIAGGMTESDADAHARAQIADWARLADTLKDVDQRHAPSHVTRSLARIDDRAREKHGRWLMVADLWQDVRYATRRLVAQPGFTAVAVLTLALGIGANTAIFSVVYGVLLKPLPFPEPERLVGVYHRGEGVNLAVMNQGPATYFTYLNNHRAFEAIGAWESDEVSITGRGDPERVEALTVTDTTLPLLRVQPALGRLFGKEDDRPGSPLRVVLTHGYWQRKFGGAPDVIGQPLDVDGEVGEIIGVLPSSFRFLRSNPDVLLPMRLERVDFVMFDFQAVARLKPGVTLAQANADIGRMIPLLQQGHERLKLRPNVRPLTDDVTGDIGKVLWILLAAVGVVLLIACANVANLFLVRAEGRQQELAMRVALGAGRGRIARELLSETVLLGLVAGALGLVFTGATIALLRRIAPERLPRVDEIAIDPAVLFYTLVISLVTGVLFGLIPALKFGAPTATALKERGRSASSGAGPLRMRNALVVTEVALAMMLLVVSGLMIRTFIAMRQVQPGFTRPEEVQTFRVAMPEEPVGDDQRFARTHEQIAERLSHVPGVTSVGLSSSITMDGEDNGNPLFVEHVHVPEGGLPPLRRFKTIGPGYFETMGNPVVAGRPITWTDIHQLRPVVVITETLAREYWQRPSHAVGKRVRGFGPTWYEVVGVVGQERDDGLNQPPTAIVYWPLLNQVYPSRTIAYAVRSSRVGAPGFLSELRQAVWSVNRNLPLAAVQTLDEIRASSMAQTAFAMVMLAIAGSVALLLGAVGIYGVIAYIAAQRTREIGIRIALGAQAADVRRMVLGQGMKLAGAGIAVGLIGSLAVTRVTRALLYDTSPTDPLTFAGAVPLLLAAALLACWVPARRAMRADPIVALRSE
jgi:putative ABC transport system permease protein